MSNTGDSSFKKLRDEIDAIDDKILLLLNQRLEYVKEIGNIKVSSNQAIYRPEREKEIIDRLVSKSKGALKRNVIEAIYLEIFAVSRNLELPERVAYLGPEFSFTHQAAQSRYGAISDYLSLDTIGSVFEAVASSRAKYGVVPIENNQEGTVQETVVHLNNSEVKIIAELIQPIFFCIASLEDNLQQIKTIYSRDIAFKQCKKFIAEYMNKDVKLIPVNSTSKACQIVNDEKFSAAFCSPIAAKNNKLPILYQNIQDSTDNHTRFLILAQENENIITHEDKTSLIVYLSDEPGSLVKFLKELENLNINLCKVESHPAKIGSKFKYYFFIEFNGHIKDENIKKILQKKSENIKWLGSYIKSC